MSKLKILFYILIPALFFTTLQGSFAYSKKTTKELGPEEVRSTMVLKKYMSQFGTLVAGMEIMKIKEKKIDWPAIQITLAEMQKTLTEMRAADKAGNYREFTDILQRNLDMVKVYGQKKDPKVYDSFDQLTETCFKCHAAHRPSDFPLPSKEAPTTGRGGY